MPTHRPLQRRPIPTPDICVVAGCKGKPYVRGVCSSCRSIATSQGLWEAVANPKKPGSPGTARAKAAATIFPPAPTFEPIPEPPPAAEPDGCRPETPLAANPDQRPKRQPKVDVVIADDWDDLNERFELTVKGRAALAKATPPRPVPLASAPLPDLAVYALGCISDALGLVDGTEPMAVSYLTLRRLDRLAELERRNRERAQAPAAAGLGHDGAPAGRTTTVSLRPWMRPARDAGSLPPEELSRVLGSRLIALNAATQVDEMARAFELRFQLRDERGEAHTSTLSRGEPMWPWSLVSDVIYASVAAACDALVEDLHRVGYGEVEVAPAEPDEEVSGG